MGTDTAKPDTAKPGTAEPDTAKSDIAKPDVAISYVTPSQQPSAGAPTPDDMVDVAEDEAVADASTPMESADTTVSRPATEMLSFRCLQHGIYEIPANRSSDAVCPQCSAPMVRTAPPNVSEEDESASDSESDTSSTSIP